LKACGVVTGAAGKRNPVCARIACAGPLCLEAVLAQVAASSVAAVLLPQLIHQVSEVGRQFGIFGPKVLPQPFADATAYRSAGGAIDLFDALVDSVGHRGFRFALVAVTDIVPSHPHWNCFPR
jgi:hypothetical protein